jgi:hypothetical protein
MTGDEQTAVNQKPGRKTVPAFFTTITKMFSLARNSRNRGMRTALNALKSFVVRVGFVKNFVSYSQLIRRCILEMPVISKTLVKWAQLENRLATDSLANEYCSGAAALSSNPINLARITCGRLCCESLTGITTRMDHAATTMK